MQKPQEDVATNNSTLLLVLCTAAISRHAGQLSDLRVKQRAAVYVDKATLHRSVTIRSWTSQNLRI